MPRIRFGNFASWPWGPGRASSGPCSKGLRNPTRQPCWGKVKLNEIRNSAHAAAADLVIFDHDLTPSQLRNLERELDLRVIDRTQLILDIFAGRARAGKDSCKWSWPS